MSSISEILSLISVASFIAAGIFLILAVFFWFRFKIPEVIGDLSGRTARKSIARMRAYNEQSGNKSYRASSVNVSRGKITSQMTEKNEDIAKTSEEDRRPQTSLLSENNASAPASQQTELLDSEQTAGLPVDSDATIALHGEGSGMIRRSGGKKLDMLDEVIMIHTQEVIG